MYIHGPFHFLQVFPQERVESSLETIFDNNVIKYKGGNQGAVNGFLPSGSIDLTAIQSEEMWTGVTYGLAALMIHEVGYSREILINNITSVGLVHGAIYHSQYVKNLAGHD